MQSILIMLLPCSWHFGTLMMAVHGCDRRSCRDDVGQQVKRPFRDWHKSRTKRASAKGTCEIRSWVLLGWTCTTGGALSWCHSVLGLLASKLGKIEK